LNAAFGRARHNRRSHLLSAKGHLLKHETRKLDDIPPETFGDELSRGTKLCGGQYVIDEYLNSGGFGITYLARDSLSRKVVIKECFPGAMCFRANQTVRLRSKSGELEFAKILDLFEKEARALSELQHPRIVGVHQIFHDNGTAYMALDYVEGRDLLQIMRDQPERFEPDDIRRLLINLLDAVAYVHDHGILHRDISPDNILLEEDNSPVLIDFGAARENAARVSRVLSKILTVKDGYSPQEFYLAGSKQEASSDLYALAATFYHLVSGKPPPSSQLRLAAVAKKMKDPLDLLESSVKGYDRHFLHAINRCLSIFPAERIASAREWRDLIDIERRRRILHERAARDQNLVRRIEELVRASQRDLGTPTIPDALPAPRPKKSALSKRTRSETSAVAAKTGAVGASQAKQSRNHPNELASHVTSVSGGDVDAVLATSEGTEEDQRSAPKSKRLNRFLSGTAHLFQSRKAAKRSPASEVRK
jgi:serine/threonine protein kinase